jgi:hypothetical protein
MAPKGVILKKIAEFASFEPVRLSLVWKKLKARVLGTTECSEKYMLGQDPVFPRAKECGTNGSALRLLGVCKFNGRQAAMSNDGRS